MKPKSITVLVVLLVFFAAAFFIFRHMHSQSLERQAAIQSAKANFWMKFGDKNDPSDSTYIKGDTLLYFRNDSFIGKSVISIK